MIGEETQEIFATFTDWENEGDNKNSYNKKGANVAGYCQPERVCHLRDTVL